jgi:hypothetical protein
LETPPVEPDMVRPWMRNPWLYGLRIPFSFIFLGWVTLAQAIAPSFNVEIYIFTLLSSFFGLVVGAHYIDIGSSKAKFSAYLRIPAPMLAVGVVAVLIGVLLGLYMTLRWNMFFIAFVLVEGFAAVAYPRERPKIMHSYASFGLTWGTIPFLGAYFIQAGTISLLVLGLSAFVGLSVVTMHHLAIMSRESPAWKDALYLLSLYKYSVYAMALLAVVGKALGF